MAFTEAQKDAALGHLGYPVNSWARNFISDRMATIVSLSSASETRVASYIAELDSIEAEKDAYRGSNAGVAVKTDGAVLFQSQAIAEYNQQYRYYQNKLSQALGIEINRGDTRTDSLRRS